MKLRSAASAVLALLPVVAVIAVLLALTSRVHKAYGLWRRMLLDADRPPLPKCGASCPATLANGGQHRQHWRQSIFASAPARDH